MGGCEGEREVEWELTMGLVASALLPMPALYIQSGGDKNSYF